MSDDPFGGRHVVRSYRDDDRESVLQLLRDSPQASQWAPDSATLKAAGTELAWVLEVTGKVVGFLHLRAVADEAEILNLAISMPNHRQGLASILVRQALQDEQLAAVQSVYLEVRASNDPALSFYRHIGFTASGRRLAYYSNPVEDAILMTKKLTG